MLIRRRRIKLHIEHRSSRRVTAANEGITPAGSEPFSPACAPASAAHADSSQLPRSLPLSSGVLPMHLALATKPNVEAAGRSWLLSLLVKALRRLGFVILLGLLLPGWRAALSQLAVVDGIKTVAGDGFGNGIYGSGGFAGDSGPATSAELNMPFGVAFDAAGNFYIADSTNNRIRKVTLGTGVITTVAGNGTAYTYAGDGGPATSAALNSPDGVALDSAGNIYIADSGNSVIRKVTVATGIITTVAGTGVKGFSGDTGPATSAQLSTPYGIALDSAGNLYIADSGNGRVRKVTASTGIITTVAGNVPAYYPGTMTQMPAGDGGAATSSSILEPFGLAFDPSGNLYISDTAAAQIRKVSASTGIITTYAGTNTNGGLGGSTGDGGPATSALIDNAGIALDKAGNLYIADWLNNHVREVFAASGIIQTIAGNGAGGGVVGGTGTANYQGDGGPATQAELDRPYGVAVGPDGSIYVADTRNEAIRGISTSLPLPGNVSSVSFPTTPVQSSRPVQTLFLETTTAETISSISVPRSVGGAQEFSVGAVTGCAVDGVTSNAAGTVCTVPVTFSPAYPGLRSQPLQMVTSAGQINVGLDGLGTAPLAALTPGVVATVIGSGTHGLGGDGGAASGVQTYPVRAVRVDSAGNVYFADAARIRRLDAATGNVTSIVGDPGGNEGYTPDGTIAAGALIYTVNDIALDAAGGVYFADNYTVRKVDAATGKLVTIAGTGSGGYTGDGGPATSATFLQIYGIALDASGNVYISDEFNHVIRKVTAASGVVTTIAGNGTNGYSGDGGPALQAELQGPVGIAVDVSGNVFVGDTYANVVREINQTTGIITTVAGDGAPGESGDGTSATSASLDVYQIALDAAGNLYILSGAYGDGTIREVSSSTGIITRISGGGTATADGVLATNEYVDYALGLALDSTGNIYYGNRVDYNVHKIAVGTTFLAYPTTTPVDTLDTKDSPLTAALQNIGNDFLLINPIEAGSNPAISPSWYLDSSSTCPELPAGSSLVRMNPGASCAFAVDFEPLSSGTNTGSLVVTDNSLNNSMSMQTVSLSGAASGAALTTAATLMPATQDFGSLPEGTTSPAGQRTFTLTNTGAAPLTNTVTITGANLSSFVLLNICTGTLAALQPAGVRHIHHTAHRNLRGRHADGSTHRPGVRVVRHHHAGVLRLRRGGGPRPGHQYVHHHQHEHRRPEPGKHIRWRYARLQHDNKLRNVARGKCILLDCPYLHAADGRAAEYHAPGEVHLRNTVDSRGRSCHRTGSDNTYSHTQSFELQLPNGCYGHQRTDDLHADQYQQRDNQRSAGDHPRRCIPADHGWDLRNDAGLRRFLHVRRELLADQSGRSVGVDQHCLQRLHHRLSADQRHWNPTADHLDTAERRHWRRRPWIVRHRHVHAHQSQCVRDHRHLRKSRGDGTQYRSVPRRRHLRQHAGGECLLYLHDHICTDKLDRRRIADRILDGHRLECLQRQRHLHG
jgi:sugar lactone lactonase YvrE